MLNKIKLVNRKRRLRVIFGVDEVGVGPLAGPVVACALYLPQKRILKKIKLECGVSEIKDSKKTSPLKREEIFKCVKDKLLFAFGVVNAKKIDQINIHRASLLAMRLAVKKLIKKIGKNPDLILIDGIYKIPRINFPQKTIIRGDSLEPVISLASICAKIRRDRKMKNYFHKKYPEYLLNTHKGYGTKTHLALIKKRGSTPIHRRSFLKGIFGISR